MDWGFFQKNSKNKFLRDDLIFPTWVIFIFLYFYIFIYLIFYFFLNKIYIL